MKVTDEEIIEISEQAISGAEAARMLGINYKTYRSRADKLGVYIYIH